MSSFTVNMSVLPRGRRLVSVSLLAVIVIGLPGCSTTTLSNGAALGTAGAAAANLTVQNITISAASFQSLRQALAFQEGYQGDAQVNDPSLAKFEILRTNLNNYSKMLTSLAAAYTALNTQATGNESGTTSADISTLATDVNAFAAGAKAKTPPLSATESNIIATAGGIIIGAVQAGEVKRNSAKIEIQLKQVISMLSEDDMREKVVPAQKLISDIEYATADLLYGSGVYSYTPLLNQLGSPLGLTAASSADSTIKTMGCPPHACLSNGLRKVIESNAGVQARAIGDSYDTSIKALKKLETMHDELATGKPIDTATASELSSLIGELQSAATSLKAAVPATPTKG
jgi:hypothetical protein